MQLKGRQFGQLSLDTQRDLKVTNECHFHKTKQKRLMRRLQKYYGKPNGSISLYRATQNDLAYISIALAVCNTCTLLVQHFDGKVTLEQCLRAFFVGPTC